MGEYGVGIGDGPAGQVGGGGGAPGGTNPFADGSTDVGAAVGNFVNDSIQTLSTLTPLEMLLLVAVVFIGFVVLKRVF